MSITRHALDLLASGVSVVPVPDAWPNPSESKPMSYPWRQYTNFLMGAKKAEREFEGIDKMAIVCGAVSGNLLVLDFDQPGFYEEWLEIMESTEIDVSTWPHVQTINGGHHIYVRSTEAVEGNRKLAMIPSGEEPPNSPSKVAIETRGEGGIIYAPPTPGYSLVSGDLTAIPVVQAEDVAEALRAARSLNQYAEKVAGSTRSPGRPRQEGEITRAGDKANETMTWEEILTPHGHKPWKLKGDGKLIWTRAGKSGGASMTTGLCSQSGNDLLYVFTSNAHPLSEGTSYTKFAAYAYLNHGGDFSKATKELGEKYNLPTPRQQERIQEARAGLTVVEGGAARKLEPRANQVFNQTDLGNAERLVAAMEGTYRYVRRLGGWMIFDGCRYIPDDSGHSIRTLMIEEVRRMYAFAENDKNLADWADKCQAKARIDNAVSLAAAIPGVAARAEEFDADPWVINTPGGVVDLRTGDMRPHEPGDLHTKVTSVTPAPEFDPEGCPHFLQMIAFAFQGDDETADWLMRYAGYTLTGLVKEEQFAFLFGVSKAGKSKFVEAILGILGDYGAKLDQEVLMAGFDKKSASDYSALAELHGKRMVVAEELESGRYLNESLIKNLVGTSSIPVKKMHQDIWQMPITFKLWLLGNYKPDIRNFDDAIARRLNVVPFVHTVPVEKRDNELPEKLKAEYPMIFRLLIDMCKEWMDTPLRPSQAIQEVTDDYRVESDRIQCFLDDVVTPHPTGLVTQNDLWKNYQSWCKANGYKPGVKSIFAKRLSAKNIKAQRRRTGIGAQEEYYYTGYQMIEVEP